MNPRPQARRQLMIALVVTAAIVLPFAGKAVHMDDPLFIAAARQIQTHPFDPYGFQMNWYGKDMPFAEITKNPPLTSYYLALAAALAGWSEVALHAAMTLVALAFSAGVYLLAATCCRRPLLAVLLAIFTPAFLISSTTLMCDVMMLAAWVFAVLLWMRGLETRNHGNLAAAMALVAVAALTKYFAIALLPLLLVVGWVKPAFAKASAGKQPTLKAWWLHALIPIAVLSGYQVVTRDLYGRGLLLDAFAYSPEPGPSWAAWASLRMLAAPAFTGGCIATVLFMAPWLWPRRTLLAAAVATLALTALVASLDSLGGFHVPAAAPARWWFAGQVAIWCTSGVAVLSLAISDWYARRDAQSLMLGLWLLGTFMFAGFINWTVNGRTVLPMVVPAAILVVRRLDGAQSSRPVLTTRPVRVAVSAAAVLAIVAAAGDASFANAARTGARAVGARTNININAGGRPIWFQGHWGFQYYMESQGAKPADVTKAVQQGDFIVTPSTNTNIFPLPAAAMTIRDFTEMPLRAWIATMAPTMGASFYADMPLPFAIGPPPIERVTVREFTGG